MHYKAPHSPPHITIYPSTAETQKRHTTNAREARQRARPAKDNNRHRTPPADQHARERTQSHGRPRPHKYIPRSPDAPQSAHAQSRSTSGAAEQTSAGTISADRVKEHLFCCISHEQPRGIFCETARRHSYSPAPTTAAAAQAEQAPARPAPVPTRTDDAQTQTARPRRSARTTTDRSPRAYSARMDAGQDQERRAQNKAPAPDNYQRAPHDSNRPRYLPAPTNVSKSHIIHAPRQLKRRRKIPR